MTVCVNNVKLYYITQDKKFILMKRILNENEYI